MLIRFGEKIRLTRRVEHQLEQLTGVRPQVNTVAELKAYLRQQWTRFSDGSESHQLIRAHLLEKAKGLLGGLPVEVDRSASGLLTRAGSGNLVSEKR